MKYTFLWITFFVWLSPILKAAHAGLEDCSAPILSSFSTPKTDGFDLQWIDFNVDVLHWEIEIVEKNQIPSGISNYAPIFNKYYSVNDLEQGKSYDSYIRSVCASGISSWNGPYTYNTAIENGSGCGLHMIMTDDNCPGVDSFFIEIDLTPLNSLGTDVLIDQVSLIIDHPWVADLKLSLLSPDGTETTLTENHGIGKADYGSTEDIICVQALYFNDLACSFLDEFNYPYTGFYIPDEPLSIFNNGQNPNGQWKLMVCDRVQGDVGHLIHFEIHFKEGNCRIPDDLYITDISDSKVDFEWNISAYCDSLRITYGPQGFNPENGIIKMFACNETTGSISGLSPNFSGEYYCAAICSEDTLERLCPIEFITACAPISLKSDFDDLDICQPGCNNECPVDSIWYNADNDEQNWYVFRDETGTEFTGPNADYFGNGHYLYTESSSIECQGSAASVLRTNCILVPEDQGSCSFSYRFFMYGEGIHKLILQLSLDGGNIWVDIDSLIGQQGTFWQDRTIDLSPYSGDLIQLQFVSFGAFDQFGDIAIDELYFHGAQLTEEICYFRDQDNDGYGNAQLMDCICSTIIPAGYVANASDCNDFNEFIFPDAIEIPCNLIDENCNGDMDDHEGNDIILIDIFELTPASCNGAFDGIIEISLEGGAPPYDILWSNGDTGKIISNLGTGMYSATITDAEACQTQLEDIYLDNELEIDIDIIPSAIPSCPGIADGNVQSIVTGGLEPYTYLWSTGDTTGDLNNIGTGMYQLTVFDQNNCLAVSNIFELQAPNPISAGIQLKNNVFCSGGNQGYIVLGAFGGQAPYSFEWDNGSTSNILQNLSAGYYTCTIQDQAGCQIILDSLQISEPPVLELNLDVLDDPICFGEPGGSIEVSASGGTAPYSFYWSNGAITDDIFLLSPGIYSVTVYDSKACQSILQNLELQAPTAIELDIIEKINTSCPGSGDGQIIIDVTGGGGTYSYFWSNEGMGDQELNDIPVGEYNVVVVDQFGCKSRIDNIDIISYNYPLEVLTGETSEPQCFGDQDGEINIQITAAEFPIDINWSSGQKKELFQLTDKITGLSPGSYHVTVTDHYGCVGISEEIELTAWEQLSYNIVKLMNISCFGLNDGSIEIEAIGGNAPYTYFWDNGALGPIIEQLDTDTYKLLIIDDNSCSVFTSVFIISEPKLLNAEISVEAAINGQMSGSASLFPTGGTVPYTIQWDENTNFQTGNTAINLAPGFYSVSIVDANLCMMDTIVEIGNIVGTKNELNTTGLTIYPNPVKEDLIILFEDNTLKSVNVLIYSAHGILNNEGVLSVNAGYLRLSTNHLPPGLYFVKLIDPSTGTTYIQNIIKTD